MIIAGISWYAVTQSKEMVIPFSSVEKTIKAQNGAPVTIEEKRNGTLHISTPDGEYVSNIPPNSQMINKLVETYNVQYSFSSTNKSALWILGGLMAASRHNRCHYTEKIKRWITDRQQETKPFHP